MNLNTIKPDCSWCLWNISGYNMYDKPVYYPIDYCGYHKRESQNNTYYVFDDPKDERVFISYDEMYEYCIDNQYFYKDSDGVIFDCSYEDLNEEQKDLVHYRQMLI